MQTLEILFVAATTVLLLRLLIPSNFPRVKPSLLIALCFVVLGLGLVLECYRWQMIPAYAVFGFLTLASRKRAKTHVAWRISGTVAAGIFITLSVFLGDQLPVVALPAPQGPYAVGTFDYSSIDHSRQERFAPERNREIYVQTWYPAENSVVNAYPLRSLWQELYAGDFDMVSFFSGYLTHVDTHSHANAPIAEGGPYPVLLFNHSLFGFTDHNTLLMEHLVSHGYIVFSISHPYQSMKVNLAQAGTIPLSFLYPDDVGFASDGPPASMASVDFGGIDDAAYSISTSDRTLRMKALHGVLARFSAELDAASRRAIVRDVISQGELEILGVPLAEEALNNFLMNCWHLNRSVQDWVEDIQFVADNIADVDAPIDGFSENLATDEFGVFGMSFGGAAAGEFCKIDSRCRAGTNLDGAQWGQHWNSPVRAPFLMIYNEVHRGGNDYAYLPPHEDFFDYTISNTRHLDYTDIPYVVPLLRTFGLAGEIGAERIVALVNDILLEFFDHYLKGKPMQGGPGGEIPEIEVRQHDQ